jgi:hypothetical protein
MAMIYHCPKSNICEDGKCPHKQEHYYQPMSGSCWSDPCGEYKPDYRPNCPSCTKHREGTLKEAK